MMRFLKRPTSNAEFFGMFVLCQVISLFCVLLQYANAQTGSGLQSIPASNGLDYSTPMPNVDLDFSQGYYQGCSLVECLSVTNASGGYVTNLDGTLTLKGANTPRIGVGTGLLVEESRTNLALRSQAFQTTWVPLNVFDTSFATVTAAPDSTVTGQKLTENTTSGNHNITQTFVKAASNLVYTTTVYAKVAERSRIVVFLTDNTTNGVYTVADISGVQVGVVPSFFGTGFSSATSSVQGLSNGWVRVTLTATSNTSTQLQTIVGLDNGTGTAGLSQSYAGTNGNGAYIWGSQLEQAAFPSSYFPTTTASATRAADNVSTVGALNSIITSAAASFVSLIGPPSFPTISGRIIGDASGIGKADQFISSSTVAGIYNGATALTATTGAGTFNSGSTKVGASYDASGRSVVVNNGTVATDALGSQAIVNGKLGSQAGTANFLNGYILRIQAWNVRLPDNVLGPLTDPLRTPTVGLDFAGSNYTVNGYPVALSTLLTNTNSTGGYCTNGDGSLTLIGANLPRVCGGTGLLVEEARTNINIQSQNFVGGWNLAGGTRTAAAGVAPDGTTTATQFVSSGGQNGIFQLPTVLNATVYSDTVFLKNIAGSPVVRVGNDVNSRYCDFNLSTLAITNQTNASCALTPYTSGWYRASVVMLATTQTSASSLVDQLTSTTGDTYQVWGYQREAATFPTSYIPTTTVAVARSTDVTSATGQFLQALQLNTGSVVAWDLPWPTNSLASGILSQAAFTAPYWFVQLNGNVRSLWNSVNLDAAMPSGNWNSTNPKYAIGYDGAGRSLVINNGTLVTDANAITPARTTGTLGVNDTYRQSVRVWNYRLPDTILKGATLNFLLKRDVDPASNDNDPMYLPKAA